MIIRPIESRDIKELFDLRALTRENPLSREDLRKMGITEESTEEKLGTTLQGWLCEGAGKIVGFAMGDGTTGELSVIAVLPEFEGRGIGSQLLAVVEAWLVSRGREGLWLWTWPDPKTRAFSFYLKHGWTVFETKADIVYMKKKKKRIP